MKIFYIVLLMISIINIIVYMYKKNKFSNVHMALMFVFTSVAIWGDVAILLSTSVEEAILAKKISYVGAACITPFICLVLLQLCGYKISRIINLIVYIMIFLNIAASGTIGYNGFLYSNIVLKFQNGLGYLEKDSGPGRVMHYGLIIIYFAITLVMVFNAFLTKRKVSRKNVLLIIVLCTITVGGFFLGKLVKIKYDIIDIAYIIDEFILLYISHRINMYDVDSSVMQSIEKEKLYGYIVLDNKLNYIGSNNVANELFKEFDLLRIDLPFIDGDGYIFKDILAWVDELEHNEKEDFITKIYKRDTKIYECKIKKMYYHSKVCGYLVEVIDDTDRQNYMELLNSYNSALEDEVEEKTSHIMEMQDKILFAIGNMVENRDDSTGGHINRTSNIVSFLIEEIKRDNEYGCSYGFYDAIIKTAPLHDLGKISIDDNILKKPGKLTDEEYEIMKTHSAKGAEIVENILSNIEDDRIIKVASNIARHHHEKWNGTGYPNKLSEENIPLEARIMAIADVYDALVSERCYKAKMSFEQANEVIISSMGSHFDPSLQKYYERAREKFEEFYKNEK